MAKLDRTANLLALTLAFTVVSMPFLQCAVAGQASPESVDEFLNVHCSACHKDAQRKRDLIWAS